MTIGKLETADSMAILNQGTLGRLGCLADGKPYVVPVNYYFDGSDIYIHSLPGRKVSALRAAPDACLQVDEIRDAYHWRSVIAYGKYEEISDQRERDEVLADIFKRLPHLSPVEARMTGGTTETIVFRIRVNEITGLEERW
jgi:nitroimidazol reductase NimA-like FMN-containing flavoprotein (pyridoxamine 5'-phosphate oxidase superfamily)